MKKIPFCYELRFGTEAKDEGGQPLGNVFLLTLSKKFHDFIKSDFETILKEHPFPADLGRTIRSLMTLGSPENMKNFYIPNVPELNKRTWNVFYYLVLPKLSAKEKKDLGNCWREELKNLAYFLGFLNFASRDFAEKFPEELEVNLITQDIIPQIHFNGTCDFSIEVSGMMNFTVCHMLRSEKFQPEEKARMAINSVIESVDKDLTRSTDVSIREDYIQAQVFGNHTCLIIDNSMPERGKMMIVSKYADLPLQSLALLAGIARILPSHEGIPVY